MFISIGTVVALFTWCIYKVIKFPGEKKHMHGFEITGHGEADRQTERDK